MSVLDFHHNRRPGPRAGVQLLAGTTPEVSWTPDQVRGDGYGFAVEAQKLLAISLEGSVG